MSSNFFEDLRFVAWVNFESTQAGESIRGAPKHVRVKSSSAGYRIKKLAYQCLHVRRSVFEYCIYERPLQIQTFNPLFCPVGAYFGARNSPYFLRIVLEEGLVEHRPEIVRYPLFKRGGFARMNASLKSVQSIAEGAVKRRPESQAHQSV